MTFVLLSIAVTTFVCAAGLALIAAGARSGDRPGETLVSSIRVDRGGRGVFVVMHNLGDQAVLIGASLRHRSLRLLMEGGGFVTVPRSTTGERLSAGRHTVVSALAAGETETVFVPATVGAARRAELVVAIGEASRLRLIHRAVDLDDPLRARPPDGRPPRTGADCPCGARADTCWAHEGACGAHAA